MSAVIWKYPLEFSNDQTVVMPEGSIARYFAMQDGVPTLWAQVLTTNEPTRERFGIYGTGHSLNLAQVRAYIGTTQDGPFVWHLYQLK